MPGEELKMNVERILELADLIEQQPHASGDGEDGFCMAEYRHDCGTPSCIGGWASFKWGDNRGGLLDAAEILGLDHALARQLFDPGMDFHYWSTTPAEAALTLRHLAKTGEVVWELDT